MVNHSTFSTLRLGRLFPEDELGGYPYYTAARADGAFDTEYLGGQWHEEVIDGVQLFFPASAGTMLGAVQLWGSRCVASGPVREKPRLVSDLLVREWAANANRVLRALDLPVRMGSPEDDVRALAAGQVLRTGYPDGWYSAVEGVARGTVGSLHFACRAPDIYHLTAVIHAGAGLVRLTVLRPDLVRGNGARGGYEACFGGMHDEGVEDAEPNAAADGGA